MWAQDPEELTVHNVNTQCSTCSAEQCEQRVMLVTLCTAIFHSATDDEKEATAERDVSDDVVFYCLAEQAEQQLAMTLCTADSLDERILSRLILNATIFYVRTGFSIFNFYT